MKAKKIPLRMCVGCQTMKSKKELMRVVRTPQGEVVLDPTGKKAGRGAYICQSEQCLTTAFKEKRLEKALKHQIDEAVYNALRVGITQ